LDEARPRRERRGEHERPGAEAEVAAHLPAFLLRPVRLKA